MMRRFSRRRRSGAGDVAIDAERAFAQVIEQGSLGLRSLAPLPEDATGEVPASYAAIGTGEDENGATVLVSFAPRSAGDALFGGLIVASKLAREEDFSGELIVLAPRWSAAASRRLALVGPKPYRVRALAAPALAETSVGVEPEHVGEPGVVPVAAVAKQLARPADRELFARALAALEGLASKHGGAVRGFERSVELVIMARRVAALRVDESGVLLNTVLPTRSSLRLAADSLAGAFDALEGNLRKRLGDRRTREGDEGVRSRLQPLVASALELRSLVCWPVGGKDLDVIDSVGVNSEGTPVATAARSSLSLAALGVILDSALELRASLPVVLARAEAPVRLDLFRLALISKEFSPGVAQLLPLLNLSHDLIEIRTTGRGLEVSICASGEAVPISSARGRRGRGSGSPRRGRERGESASDSAARPGEAEAAPADSAALEKAERQDGTDRNHRNDKSDESDSDKNDEGEESGGGRGRSRRRGRRSRGGARERAAASPEDGESSGEKEEKTSSGRPRFEEMSSFDLGEEVRSDEGDDADRPRRRGRRSRGRRRGAAEQPEGASEGPGAVAAEPRGERNDEAPGAEDSDEDETLDLSLSELPEVMDEVEEPTYDDDDEESGEDESGSLALEREKRRRQRQKSKGREEKPPEAPKPVRRRVAIVAHADRDSVIAAVLLARELRLVEGIWVYTQAELMSFFRGGATDLRDGTPIYVIGFTPSPARDVIQAAAIYAGRLTWIDHRQWPPEDLGALREALGEEQVWVVPGVGSSLPLLIKTSTRRSRFSDKLVDLAAGRFTEHDYERWGRVWWWRLGEIAKRSGSRKSDLDPLLSGRPSDLAKEAETAEVPDPPPEVEFVSARDFRLVHFAGHGMVMVEVPEQLDLNLAARIARERYHASLSLAFREGEEMVILAGDEGSGRRTLDFTGLVDHLAEKLEWVTSLPDHDHVARFLIRDRPAHPERLDDVVGEIVMGRSLLER